MRLSVTSFRGMSPATEPKLLADGVAAYARNAVLRSGSLDPLRDVSAVAGQPSYAGKQSIWRNSETSTWLSWNEAACVCRGPITDDPYDRVYVTRPGYPPYASAQGTGPQRSPGIPAPTLPPGVSGAGKPSGLADTTQQEPRSYVYTFVNEWGEESPPSPPSYGGAPLYYWPGESVSVYAMQGSPASGSHNIVARRVYCATVGASGTEYQYVGETSGTTYTDTSSEGLRGEVISTTDWMPMPTDAQNLALMANGIMLASRERTLLVSEPYLPSAWPPKYRIQLDDRIVAIVAFGQSAAVLTDGPPVIVSGADSASLTVDHLAFPQACVAARSAVALGDSGVVYASPDGLCLIGTQGSRILTDGVLTRDQWQAYVPSSIRALAFETRLLLLYRLNSGVRGAIVIDSDANLYEADIAAVCGYSDPVTDTLYLTTEAGALVTFDSGAALQAVWRSKRYVTPVSDFAAAQVCCEAYPATLLVWGDGVLRTTATVSSSEPIRLPASGLCRVWQFEVRASARVTEVTLASVMDEL